MEYQEAVLISEYGCNKDIIQRGYSVNFQLGRTHFLWSAAYIQLVLEVS